MSRSRFPNKLTLQRFKKDITDKWPLAKGSLAQVYNRCIRPNCPACASGKKHRTFIFSYLKKGHRHCMYVPLELVTVMRRAISNSRKLEALISALGPELILQFRQKQTRLNHRKHKKV